MPACRTHVLLLLPEGPRRIHQQILYPLGGLAGDYGYSYRTFPQTAKPVRRLLLRTRRRKPRIPLHERYIHRGKHNRHLRLRTLHVANSHSGRPRIHHPQGDCRPSPPAVRLADHRHADLHPPRPLAHHLHPPLSTESSARHFRPRHENDREFFRHSRRKGFQHRKL